MQRGSFLFLFIYFAGGKLPVTKLVSSAIVLRLQTLFELQQKLIFKNIALSQIYKLNRLDPAERITAKWPNSSDSIH